LLAHFLSINERIFIMNRRIFDGLVILFLVLTIWHSAHILAGFELPGFGWLAWPLSIGVDVGIAVAAWVASRATLRAGARRTAGIWLIYLLVFSYGLNLAYYTERGATAWGWALASAFPISLAAVGMIKSFVDHSETTNAQGLNETVELLVQAQLRRAWLWFNLERTRVYTELEETRTQLALVGTQPRMQIIEAPHVTRVVEFDETRARDILRAFKSGETRGGYGQDEAVKQLRALFEETK
jgi:hypothetical protein